MEARKVPPKPGEESHNRGGGGKFFLRHRPPCRSLEFNYIQYFQIEKFFLNICHTVVPHLMTLIHSSEIAVERKHRKAKIKNPLKCIKTRLMCSSGLKTHRPTKILHTAAIFGACIARNPSLSTARSHFEHLVAILKTRRSAVLIFVM